MPRLIPEMLAPARGARNVIGRTFALALLAIVLIAAGGCNDGSTGCCMVCNGSCACGNSCQDCSVKCTLPHGCACSPMEAMAEERSQILQAEPMSQSVGANTSSVAVCGSPAPGSSLVR